MRGRRETRRSQITYTVMARVGLWGRTDDVVRAEVEQRSGELLPNCAKNARCDRAETIEHL